MGLPDDWLKYGDKFVTGEDGKVYVKTEEISDSQKYKLAGNGVVVNVVEELIKTLIYDQPQQSQG
jgi:site-specific DNA-cytosine methylase